MSLDIVIPLGPGEDNEELRHCLRGIAENVPHRWVWIVGYLPSWVSDEVRHIPTQQDPRAKWANSRMNRLAACRHPEVSDEFLLFNDDFFVMQPVEAVPLMHEGLVEEALIKQSKRIGNRPSAYIANGWQTREWLSKRVTGPILFYELHVPMPVQKAGFKEALEAGEQSGLSMPHIRTIYGNLQGVGGEYFQDMKAPTNRWVPPNDAVYVSTNLNTWTRGRVGQWVRKRLATPCRYERTSGNITGANC